MNAKVLREGRVRLWLEPEDRGLAYGDGVFETLRVCGGAPAMWREHWARLCVGATRLGIALPDEGDHHACRRDPSCGGRQWSRTRRPRRPSARAS